MRRRREVDFLEVNHVFVRAVERFAGLIAKIHWINRILGQVRAEA